MFRRYNSLVRNRPTAGAAEVMDKLVQIKSPEEVAVGTIEADEQILLLSKNKIILIDLIKDAGEMVAEAEYVFNEAVLKYVQSIDDDHLDRMALTRNGKRNYCELLCNSENRDYKLSKVHLKKLENSWSTYDKLEQAYKKLRP